MKICCGGSWTTEAEWFKDRWPKIAHLVDDLLEERKTAEPEIQKKLSAVAINHAGFENELEYQKMVWVLRRCKELGVDTNG